MKSIMVKYFTIVSLVFFQNTYILSQSLYNEVGHIPQNCQINWTNAGLQFNAPITANLKITITNQAGNDDYAVEQALNQAKVNNGLTIIYFPAGTYQLTQTITLTSIDGNNIVFKGDGINTILEFQVDNDKACLNFMVLILVQR